MAIVMPDIGNGLIMIFNVLVITMMMRGMALMIMMLIIMPLRMTMIITTRMILFAGRPNRESAETGGGGASRPRQPRPHARRFPWPPRPQRLARVRSSGALTSRAGGGRRVMGKYPWRNI